ncbi:MAG: prepilin-type N-terminal cleavage/methylation domain-containing protein [Sumerlaeia bacterium]
MTIFAHLRRNRTPGFTLIELLIVVAIIAILAAIAVPNFLEAQTRSKVSRALADMRTVATGIESYRVDTNKFPLAAVDAPHAPAYSPATFSRTIYVQLTTPISYLTSFPVDAFQGDKEWAGAPTDPRNLYDYRRAIESPLSPTEKTLLEMVAPGVGSPNAAPAGSNPDVWLLYSPGPDKWQNINRRNTEDGLPTGGFGAPMGEWPVYDATNGTISVGDIIRSSYGGGDALVSR